MDAGPELAAKWLDLAKQSLPGLSRVAVLFWSADPAHPDPKSLAYREATESAARRLGLALHVVLVRYSEDFPGVFAAIERARQTRSSGV